MILPDRYVFNYRASYAGETDAAVRYFVKMRRIPPRQIAVFARSRMRAAMRDSRVSQSHFVRSARATAGILRLNYQRNTVDVDDAVNQLKAQKVPIKAVVMICSLSGRREIHREDCATSFPE